MTLSSLNVGRKGELAAVKYISSRSEHILYRNFRTRFGEIDIISKIGNTIYFYEVKARIGTKKGFPYEAVNKAKITTLNNVAQSFVLKNNFKNYKLCLKVISIVFNDDISIQSIKEYELLGY